VKRRVLGNFFYPNGKLNIKGNYKNDEEDGYWQHFHVDGTVDKTLTGTYKNGVKVSD
tara:strand:- start:197 stop:367 length:171 start_codon:yes stop_codon:yes gene_type:complete